MKYDARARLLPAGTTPAILASAICGVSGAVLAGAICGVSAATCPARRLLLVLRFVPDSANREWEYADVASGGQSYVVLFFDEAGYWDDAGVTLDCDVNQSVDCDVNHSVPKDIRKAVCGKL